MSSTSPKREIPKTYESSTVEERIYDFWNSGGYFTPKIDKNKTPFTMIMPPPNVTGELHMGHALTIALEDLIVRWQRMQGRPTLYLPGSDHAGIATQVVVERTLSEINLSRHDIGREEFINRVLHIFLLHLKMLEIPGLISQDMLEQEQSGQNRYMRMQI